MVAAFTWHIPASSDLLERAVLRPGEVGICRFGRRFEPDITFKPKSFHVYGPVECSVEPKSARLRCVSEEGAETIQLEPDPASKGYGIPGWRPVRPMRELYPGEHCDVIVRNAGSSDVAAGVVIVCGTATHEHFFGGTASARPIRAPDYRFERDSDGYLRVGDRFPCACRIQEITIRSNSQQDIFLKDMRIGDMGLIVGGDIPVEFFRDGVALNWVGPALPCQTFTLCAMTVATEMRWIEVDLKLGEP